MSAVAQNDRTDRSSRTHRTYEAGWLTRALPRVMAGSILLSSLLVAYRFDSYPASPWLTGLKGLVVLAGGALALWLLRAGAEVRLRIWVDEGHVHFRDRNANHAVALADLNRLLVEPPLVAGNPRRLWPATTLIDEQGHGFRIPACLAEGERLIGEILEVSGREDLDAWAESLKVTRWMSRTGSFVVLGYLLSGAVLIAGTVFYFR